MRDRYCIIGAGPAGLATARTFKELGIPFDCLEQESVLGGVWNIDSPGGRVYSSTFMISSKKRSGFIGFPMPDHYPVFPSHKQILDYLESYAEAHGLVRHIDFSRRVEAVAYDGCTWRVSVAGESQFRHYRGVVVASGHHREPEVPELPGIFDGEMIHSSEYKGPEQLSGRRVLIIGGGNSGCDISVEAAHHASVVCHSLRNSRYFFPKFIAGKPIDRIYERAENLPLPSWLREKVYRLVVGLTIGSPCQYGLPAPRYGIVEVHPTINSQFLSYVGHGRISVQPQVTGVSGNYVEFSDGRCEEFDLIIFATGYKPEFPYLEPCARPFSDDGKLRLLMNVFDPSWLRFYMIGLFQTNGGYWPLSDWQARSVGAYIALEEAGDSLLPQARAAIASMHERNMKAHALMGERRAHEIDYVRYKKTIRRLAGTLNGMAEKTGANSQPRDAALPSLALPRSARTLPASIRLG